ncbi:MAG: hypothetical protein E7631_06360 [Ruminococcaceae bacterium]|nr:hypothetical protein [Oscillospiraceae bacterium]
MKKVLSLILASMLVATLAVSAAAVETLSDDVARNFGFGVKKANTAWAPDGVKSEGEYYDIDYLPEWCVGVCHDASLSDEAQNLDVDVAVSWDDTYLYTWLSYTEGTGHHFDATEHSGFWDGEIVQLGAAEIDVAVEDAADRLETGYGMYTADGSKATMNWADGKGTGHCANNSGVDDFECFVDGNTITYEIRTPFNAFTSKSVEEGLQFKLCYVICYDGGAGEYLMWSLGDGVTGGAKDASLHANVTLEAAPVVEVVEDVVVEDAPQTFDAGVIAAVAAIVSAAGYAISKKR